MKAWVGYCLRVARCFSFALLLTGPFMHPSAEAFLYDADGNLTNDDLWRYTWDAENRPDHPMVFSVSDVTLAVSRRHLDW